MEGGLERRVVTGGTRVTGVIECSWWVRDFLMRGGRLQLDSFIAGLHKKGGQHLRSEITYWGIIHKKEGKHMGTTANPLPIHEEVGLARPGTPFAHGPPIIFSKEGKAAVIAERNKVQSDDVGALIASA